MGLLFAATAVLLATISFVSADGINIRARRNGKLYFGTQVSTAVLNNASANAIVIRNQDFGTYTCEYEMKWAATEASRNTFTFAAADRIVKQALSNGMIMRCHNLVWHQSVPTWVPAGNYDNATLISIMVNHINNVVTHYKGKCYAWDVVNEAIADTGGVYRGSATGGPSIWYQTIGISYIPIAFAAAAAADPNVKLYYNDYNIEYAGIKRDAAVGLVQMVRSYGARIDGVGLQGHFTTGKLTTQSDLVTSLNTFAALGVEVAYTEMDISTPSSSPNFAQQAMDYATAVGACMQVSACVGITVWGYTDEYTSITNSDPDLWDTNLLKKPAYYSTLETLGPDPIVDSCGCASF